MPVPRESAIHLGEKELTAFIAAVRDLYGDQHAEQADELWLEVFIQTSIPSNQDRQVLRQITIQSASRMAEGITGMPTPGSAGGGF